MGAATPLADDAPPADPTQTAVVEFRCEQCGAPVTAEPGKDALTCGHCGHSQPIERKAGLVVEYDFEAALRDAPRGSASDLATGAREVECKGCGARTVTTSQSQVCSFCGAALIADLRAGDKLMLPESLLPHKVSRDEAKAGFQRWLRSRWFAPNDLARRAKTSGLDGVMLPHWTYDSSTMTSYSGLRGDHYYVTVSYTDSKGNSRTRTEQRTRWSPRRGTVYVAFDDVLVSASKSLPATLVQELEPWDLSALQPFDPAYLAGYVTERYAIDLQAGFDLADGRMRPTIRSAINRDIGGDVQQILSMDVTHRNVKFKHVLLPLWISSFRYGERVFRVMVNARTGEVQGERPWSWIKILLFALFICALIGGGLWLYYGDHTRSSDGEDDGYTPTADTRSPEPVPPRPEPPPAPPPPVIAPLAQVEASRALAQTQLPGALLAGITITDVDEHGIARGAAVFRYRAPKVRAGSACQGAVTLAGDGLSWSAADEAAGDCDAQALAAPTCSLADVMARVPALTPGRGTPAITYQPRALAEAPPGHRKPGASSQPIPGAWQIQDNARTVTVDDDCGPPPPKPRPARGRPR